MNIRYEDGMKILSPSEGKYLTDGETYTESEVYMKATTPHDNWSEVGEKPAPPEPEEEISDTEALNIITGLNDEEE